MATSFALENRSDAEPEDQNLYWGELTWLGGGLCVPYGAHGLSASQEAGDGGVVGACRVRRRGPAPMVGVTGSCRPRPSRLSLLEA